MTKDYFANRVSIRAYENRDIPTNLIEEIIEKAMRAPTCGNMQLYSVIVTREKEKKEKLANLHFNQPAATGSNVILTICADFNLFTRWCELSNAVPGYDNFHSFIMAFTDAVIFAQQIVTVAESEGLGTCYLGTVNYTANEISQLLELPEKVVPVASISLGYPAESPSQPDRLPVAAILHEEKYRRDSDEEVKSFFEKKESLPENHKFVIENNKQTLAQVFTDIRYPRETNETVSKSFKSLIESKGFH
ncbi:MAG: nitroreductase family protein, partial [Muribaculaceae bacterium]|nr:nitroreductase family protein [Muribaculaceae bacterium]